MRWKFLILNRRGRSAKLEEGTGHITSTPQLSDGTRSADSVEDRHFAVFSSPQDGNGLSSLSLDLLISIFELAIYLDAESDFYPAYDIQELFRINAVCRHWRWMVLNSPSFWTYITTDCHTRLILLFLRRSSDALLHVRVQHEVFREWSADLRSQVRSLSKLSLLIPHFHRVRFLSLALSTFALSKIDSELIDSHRILPHLEGLRFEINATVWKRLPELSVLSLLGKLRSPILRKLHFVGVNIPADALAITLLSQLSLTLACRGISVPEYLGRAFKECNSLVSLSLDIWEVGTVINNSAAIGHVPLPNLRRLSLDGPYGQCVLIRRMLSTPSLKEIRLMVAYSDIVSAAQLLPELLPANKALIKVVSGQLSMAFGTSKDATPRAKEEPLFTLFIGYRPFYYGNNLHLVALLNSCLFTEITLVDFATLHLYDKKFMLIFISHFPHLHALGIRYLGTTGKFPIEDSFDLRLLRPTERNSALESLRHLVLDSFDVIMPQSTPFLDELCSIAQQRRYFGLVPFVPEFRNCKGVTDSLRCELGTSAQLH